VSQVRRYLASPNVPALYRDTALALFEPSSSSSLASRLAADPVDPEVIVRNQLAQSVYRRMGENDVHHQRPGNRVAGLWLRAGLPCYCRDYVHSELYRRDELFFP
jgi:hypothetical protein